jgi:NADPH-dependent curcumin reductase CurA
VIGLRFVVLVLVQPGCDLIEGAFDGLEDVGTPQCGAELLVDAACGGVRVGGGRVQAAP